MSVDAAQCSAGIVPRRCDLALEAGRLSYLEWGDRGAPILLLHGITSSARGWWRVAPALVAAEYHVYAVDMPGHGQSSLADAHHIDRIAAVVAHMLRLAPLAGATVIGHSWGGAVAIALATSASDHPRPQRVALIDPLLAMDPARGQALLPRYLEGLGRPPTETLPIVRAANPDWHPCDCFWKSEALQQCRPEAVQGLFTDSGAWDLTARLARIAMPLLVLLADPHHTIIAPATRQAMAQALRGNSGRLATIPGATHNIFRDRFDAFMHVLRAWLQGRADLVL